MIDDLKQKLKKWYDDTSDRYDAWGDKSNKSDTVQSFSFEFDSFKKLLKIKNGDKVLDIATGTGIYLLEAVKDGAVGYGVDISEKMLDVLRKKAEKMNLQDSVHLTTGTAEHLEFKNNFFDWVFCIGMLEYYPIDFVALVLDEIQKVLKKGGNVILDFPNSNSPKAWAFKEREDSVGTKFFIYDLKILESLLKQKGFDIKHVSEAGIAYQFLLKSKK